MTENLPALGSDPPLSDDLRTNVTEIVPFGSDDDGPDSDLCGKKAFETTPQSSETAAPRRGRGRPAGPSLKILLTQDFPDGATAEMLVEAGFRGDLAAAQKRENVKEQDGRFVWIAVSRPEATHVMEPRTSSNPPALLLPPISVTDLNKEEVRTERFRIEEISLDKINVRARWRVLDQAKVDAIADSMGRIGLQTPITVSEADIGDFELIAGLHRRAAAISLNWAKIICHVVQMDYLSRQLWEIDENLCRAELNELERGEHLAARKKIYEQLQPETRNVNERGGPGRGNKTTAESAPVSFTADTAGKTGLSERTIQQSIYRAANIAPEVRDKIRSIPEIADKGVELDALAKTPPEQQAAVVAAVRSGHAPSVRAAAKTARPTGRAALDTDKRLERILEKIKLLGKQERETLWKTLADRWRGELSRALENRLPIVAGGMPTTRPHACNEL
jgi:ParB family chromosome partitioning protein